MDISYEWRACRPRMKMRMAPFTLASLLLLVGVDGVRRDGLMPMIMSSSERKQPLSRDGVSLHDTMAAFVNLQGLPPKDVPPDFLCHSCQEVSRKAESFLADPNSYDEANNLSTELVCQVMDSDDLQIKCRRLVELYLHDWIQIFLLLFFREKNLCNTTGFCPVDNNNNNSTLLLLSTAHVHNRGSPSSEPSFAPPQKQLLPQLVLQSSKVPRRPAQYPPSNANIESRSCNACHNAANQICRELEDHDQQLLIMKGLLDVCEAFRTYSARCKVWVFEYGPLFLANLHRFLSSEDVCQLIRMCAEPAPPRKEAGHLYLRSMRHALRLHG